MCNVKYIMEGNHVRPEELIQLYTAIGWNRNGVRTVSRVAEILRSSGCCVAAYVDGTLVGFGRILSDGFSGHVLDLMTAPDYRNRGIASEIMRRLKTWASGRLISLSLVDGTGTGGRFYKRFGFSTADPGTDLLMYLTVDSTGE